MDDLITERDRLYGKLTRLWTWIEANPDRPEVTQRELVWYGTLKKYERVCDQIDGRSGNG